MNSVYRYVRKLCDGAFDISERMDLNLAIVATDLGGHPVVSLRGDRTCYAAMESARRKAVAAACMQMSTRALADLFERDPLATAAMHASGEMLIVPGGFPIVFNGGCIGGLGIAGGNHREDHIVGEQAFMALNAGAAPAGG